MAVIFNSSPLINLSKIGKLKIIEQLFNSVIVPRAVYHEVIANSCKNDFQNELETLFIKKIITIHDVQDKNLVKAFSMDIDYGESEVIALALETNAELIVIDEVDARNIADMYNLKKTGFIGLLIKAKTEGILKENVIDLIDEAINKGFWINRNLYNKILEQVKDL